MLSKGLLRYIRHGYWSNHLIAQYLLPPAILIGALVSVGVLGARQLGYLQPLELVGLDLMIRLQPPSQPDPRLLVVGITEADIQTIQQWPLSDQLVAQMLEELQQLKPRSIGLDLYRDVPQPPGTEELRTQLSADNVIAIESYGTVPAPPNMPPEQIGFNDLIIDPDGLVRRNIMFTTVDDEEYYSFSLRLSLQYLESERASWQVLPDALQIGSARFAALTPNAGGYQAIDNLGYQILFRHRHPEHIARQVTLTQVLEGNIDPDWVRDKIVLIGSTAASTKDIFFTPYTGLNANEAVTSGVLLHAQMTSQILGAVLDHESIYGFWPEWAEAVWIIVWSGMGGLFAWRVRHPAILGGGALIAPIGLFGISYVLFLQFFWVPWIAPVLSCIITGTSTLAYRRFYDVFHDSLTDLPNRANLIKRLQETIAHGQSHKEKKFAVLFLGFDQFKIINETVGHKAGDRILLMFVKRLKAYLPPHFFLARVGGDEFAILLTNLKEVQESTQFADNLKQDLSHPFELSNQRFFITFSSGIAINQPGYSYQPEDLLRDAHIAMYSAKSRGKSRHEVFAIGMRKQALVRLQTESELRRAIERQEFQVYYQPIVSLSSGSIAGFEALVRWQHPERGIVSPGEFIPVAEETGLIVPLGQWILRQACSQMVEWHRQFPADPPLMISVNLSGGQFVQIDLVDQIDRILQETGLLRSSLKLEITESMMMDGVENAIMLLLKLKQLKVKLGIDDFGTGYSSLSYLHRFPIDTLKVDRSFVGRMDEVGDDAEIVRTIVHLGHNLGMDIIAEGVETVTQLEKLRELECEYVQGYFLAKPLPQDAATNLLKNSPQW